MIVYVDLVILLNFIIDILLLISVSLLLKRNASYKRIIFAAIFGSFSTLLLFYIDNNLTLLLYKFIISIFMVIIAFRYNDFYYFKDNLFWLYIISIILGGSIYLLNNQIYLSNKGIVFSANGFKINLIILLLIGPLILYKYIKNNQKQKNVSSNYYDVVIYYNNEHIKGTAFLDTGNRLIDPYFGKPIILVNQELIKSDVKTFYVPYKGLNNEGLLPVFKPKKMIVNNKVIKKFLIGISDCNLNGIKIILNEEVL